MANRTRAQLSTDSLTNFPDNTSQLITPQDLRDWLTNGIESFVTQKDKSTFENAFYENKSVDIVATSGTTNLALATGNYVHITGSTGITITSFGSLPRGSRFILCFDIPVTLEYNATTLKIPGSADITTSAGDCIMLVSEDLGEWRVISYFPGGGLPVGTITGVTAGTGLSGGGTAAVVTLNLANVSPDPSGSFTNADITVDAQGRITSASNGSGGIGTITGVTAGTGLSGGGSSGSVTLNLADTLVTPNSYTNANITVDQQGRITAASNGSGGGGGSPGGANGNFQYKNGSAFAGAGELNYQGGFVVLQTPKIGDSTTTGHFHMHRVGSTPTGISEYLTMFWDRTLRAIGFRHENESFVSKIAFTQPTADQTYTLPDATGNVILDSASQTLSNKTYSSPTIEGPATLGNGTSAGEIRFKEGSGGGSNYVAIKATATLSADYTLTLPSTAPTEGQSMVSNSSGGLTWSSTPGRYSQQYLRAYGGTYSTAIVETKLQSILIPANTFTDMNGLQIMAMVTRTLTGSNSITMKIYINTSDAIGGFNVNTTAYSISSGASATWQFIRAIFIQVATGGSKNTIALNQATTGGSNLGSSGSVNSSAIDWAVDQYVVLSTTQNNASGTLTCNALQIIPS